MTMTRQPNMSRGEVAEAMYARVDTVDYASGLRTLRNARVMRTGGVENRAGWRFVEETRFPTKKSRLIPFVFNVASGNTFSIELGDVYFEFVQNGARIVEASQGVTAITKANPAVVTYAGADTYANGDDVVITGGDMPEIVGRRFRVAGLDAGANTFQLTHTDGSNLDSTAFTTYTGGATVAKIYKVAGGFLEVDLPKVQFAQSADVITFTCKGYSPTELVRLGTTNWTFGLKKFAGGIPRSAALTATAGGTGGGITATYRTTIVAPTGEEVLQSINFLTAFGISGATQANPVEITTAVAHGLTTGDTVYIHDVGGMDELNGHDLNSDGRDFTIVVTAADKFTLVGEDGTGYAAYTSGGFYLRSFVRLTNTNAPTVPAPNVITMGLVAQGSYFNIYKESNGIFGLIGSTAGTSFNDFGQEVDIGKTPPEPHKLFLFLEDAPTSVTYAQQRLWFGGSEKDPTTIWGSQLGYFSNFTKHQEPVASDAVTIDMAGPQVNEVKHLLELSKLLIFTSASEKSASGASDGTIEAGAAVLKTESYNGCSDIGPVIADSNVIFVQRDNSIVRDQAFDWQVNGYRGRDLTTRSSHLFDGRTIAALSFQKSPIQTVWCVRDDGILLAMTYLREEELIGWSRHDTDGVIESISTVTEGTEEAVYAVVKRTRSGPGPTTRRYIERLEDRYLADLTDAFFVDAGRTYDGRHTGAITMTLTGGPPWESTSDLTLTASSASFAVSDVSAGNAIFLTGQDLDEEGNTIQVLIKCTITAFTSSTVVTVRPHKTVPATMRAVAIATWAKAIKRITGLWHLEGRTVSVLVDGGVHASPKNTDMETAVVVAGGAIQLDQPGAVVHVGLPYMTDVETLDVDTVQGEPLLDKKKLIQSVRVHLKDSRTVWAGPNPPKNDALDALEGLEEFMAADVDDPIDVPPPLLTEVVRIRLQSRWNSNGRVFLRNVDPLPLTILAIAPSGVIPVRG